MGKREKWEELGFASFRDWRLFEAAERHKKKRAEAQAAAPSHALPAAPPLTQPLPAPSQPFELPPRVQLVPESEAPNVASAGSIMSADATSCVVASASTTTDEAATEKASQKAARPDRARTQQHKDELDPRSSTTRTCRKERSCTPSLSPSQRSTLSTHATNGQSTDFSQSGLVWTPTLPGLRSTGVHVGARLGCSANASYTL